jgi:hypothetical protein
VSGAEIQFISSSIFRTFIPLKAFSTSTVTPLDPLWVNFALNQSQSLRIGWEGKLWATLREMIGANKFSYYGSSDGLVVLRDSYRKLLKLLHSLLPHVLESDYMCTCPWEIYAIHCMFKFMSVVSIYWYCINLQYILLFTITFSRFINVDSSKLHLSLLTVI